MKLKRGPLAPSECNQNLLEYCFCTISDSYSSKLTIIVLCFRSLNTIFLNNVKIWQGHYIFFRSNNLEMSVGYRLNWQQACDLFALVFCQVFFFWKINVAKNVESFRKIHFNFLFQLLVMHVLMYLVLEVKTKTYSLVSLQDKSGVTVGTASVGLGLGLGFEPSVFGNPGQSQSVLIFLTSILLNPFLWPSSHSPRFLALIVFFLFCI